MAAEKLPSVEKRGGLAGQLEAFLSRYCGEQVQSFINDALEVDALLDDRDVLMVLYRSRPRLHVIFAAYAIAARDREKNKLSEKQEAAAVAAIMAAHHADHAITGASVGEAFQKLTLDFPAWHAMMRDGRMLDRDFTQREATTIFVKINLAEELYQVNPPATGEATVCYDEWDKGTGLGQNWRFDTGNTDLRADGASRAHWAVAGVALLAAVSVAALRRSADRPLL